MPIKDMFKFFSSLNVFAKTSSLVALIAGITGILGWMGITPDFTGKKIAVTSPKDTAVVISPGKQPLQVNPTVYPSPHKNKSSSAKKMDDIRITEGNTSEVFDFISPSCKNITSPFEIALIIKKQNNLDQKFAIQISSSLSSQGIKCNSLLFTPKIMSHFEELESADILIINKLIKYTKWYLVGEIQEIEKVNSINTQDKTAIVSFSGYLIEVAQDNTGNLIPINYIEREAGESGIAVDKARINLSKKIANSIMEKI